MNRRSAWLIIATLATSVLFAVVSTSGGVDMWGEPQWDPTPGDRSPTQIDAPIEPAELLGPPDDSSSDPIDLPGWLTATLRVIIVMVVFAVAIATLLAAWRHRPRLRWRRLSGEEDFEVLPDIASAVVEQAAAQRATLLDGAPRNAIVQCWLRLERDVAAVGLERDPAHTSLEFTREVLARYTVDSDAITQLAALYREARFSDHPLGEADRRRALDALDRLHEALGTATIGAAT